MSTEIQAPRTAEPARGPSRGRSTAVLVVLVVAGILLLLSSFAVWVNRVDVLDPRPHQRLIAAIDQAVTLDRLADAAGLGVGRRPAAAE